MLGSFLVCRFFPVLPGNGRITQDDLVVGGYFIPKGVKVIEIIYCYSLHILKGIYIESRCNVIFHYSYIFIALSNVFIK